MMDKIGLIGGLSWVSTADYYRRLNQITQSRLGGVSSARLVLESVDRQAYVDAVITRQDEAAACTLILEAARGVERAGAAFIVITCNDVHRFVPEIAPHIGIEFLHIADAAGAAIRAAGLSQVALLGVQKTMESDFYPEVLSKYGIDTLVPEADERRTIHTAIMDEMVKDLFTPETKTAYLDIIRAMAGRGAEGVVLGCTEIPLLIKPGEACIPSFSTNELHCRAAVERAIASPAQ